MILSKLRNFLAGLTALSMAGCATAPAASGQGPALWQVADEDTTIYLFGTIHLLPEGQQWRTPVLEKAIAASDELVIETILGDDPAAQAQRMARLGVSPGLPPLLERVPEDKRDALRKMVEGHKVPIKALDRMETWAAALMLASLSYRQMGLDPSLGVERGLEANYKAKARPISGLETVEEQLGYFDKLSEESQRMFLMSVLEDPAEAKAQFEAMLQTWAKGDVAGIAKTFDTELKQSPELREVLLKRRNANWAEWIDKRLDQPGSVMVAVGAGHLAGPESVQAMLAERGIKAKRLQ